MGRARFRRSIFFSLAAAGAVLAGATGLFGDCGPFTDVAADAFCPFVLEIFTLGITAGTTATTYDPASSVTRLQMAAFLSRTVDGVLKRGSPRAPLARFAMPQTADVLGLTTLGGATGERLVACDGADVWVANTSGTISRVRASDGRLLETWTGAAGAYGVLSAMGRIFATSSSGGNRLYEIDPSQAAGAVTTVATNLGAFSGNLAFDGGRIWTANADGTVSIVTPAASLPWSVTTVTIGTNENGILWDGASIWVTDDSAGLLKLDGSGAVLQTVTVGIGSRMAVFDGANIWVPRLLSSLSVVRASSGAVLATLTGNGLTDAFQAAFDGERVVVTSSSGGVSVWKAADLTALGSVDLSGLIPIGVAGDGINFWISLDGPHLLARF
jgi:hypothetical protein